MRLADRLVVAVGIHPGKAPLFPPRNASPCSRRPAAPIARKGGCDLAPSPSTISSLRRRGARRHHLIRGLRDGADFDYEMQMAGMNARMAPEVQTVFLPASPVVRPITATLVRQIAAMGGDVSAFVPPASPPASRRSSKAEIQTGNHPAVRPKTF